MNKKSEIVNMRTWFGMNAALIIGPGFLHRAGFGRLLFPHPPIVNWLLRQKLNASESYSLSLTHEFGHFQTLPLVLLYVGVILKITTTKDPTSVLELIFLLIITQATWEIMAEIYTIATDVRFYHMCYDGITKIPRFIFWFSTITLTTTGWIFAVL